MIENRISMYKFCPRCLDEMPDDVTPSDWAWLDVGVTEAGVQVWCARHDTNVMTLDFLGQGIVAHFDWQGLEH